MQPGAGVVLHAKPGTRVRTGQPLLTLHTDTPERFSRARDALAGAYGIGDAVPEQRPLILDESPDGDLSLPRAGDSKPDADQMRRQVDEAIEVASQRASQEASMMF